jgi:hypothetical protein
MKHFIKTKKVNFRISNSLARTLVINNFSFQSENKRTCFILNNANVSYFHVIKTVSLSHFYLLVLNKKYRVSKKLYILLKDFTLQKERLSKFIVSPLI